jgi:ubiquinone/menaquinone biosynthesis C-methylase UbiE
MEATQTPSRIAVPATFEKIRPSSRGLLPWVLAAEWATADRLPRVPEPELVMTDDSAESFERAGSLSSLVVSYWLNSRAIAETLHGCHRVVDLACGPAVQLAQVAALHPEVSFVGVDLSDDMLAQAERRVRDQGLKNVRFERGDIADLADLADESFDGAISTLSLHHLPDVRTLRRCFQEIRRIVRPNGAVFLCDMWRPKRPATVDFISRLDADRVSPLFVQDYANSLRASFRPSDFRALATLLPSPCTLEVTRPIPALMRLRSLRRPLSADKRARLAALRRGWPMRHRLDAALLEMLLRSGRE